MVRASDFRFASFFFYFACVHFKWKRTWIDLFKTLFLDSAKLMEITSIDPPLQEGSGTSKHHYKNVQAHKNCYRSSFFPRTISDLEWNHLPPHIWNANSVGCFKSSPIRDLQPRSEILLTPKEIPPSGTVF